MSMRYKGGIISATPPTTSQSSAGGVWTLEQQLQANASGAWPGPPIYIEEVFSTYLYAGTGATQTITNGIDLSTYGGMTWFKVRNSAGYDNAIVDSARGVSKILETNLTNAQATQAAAVTSYNTNGFTLGTDGSGYGTSGYNINPSGISQIVSWTFRKQAKFFDVVTYTGDGTSGRNIAHNLGSVPGCIIFKDITNARDWEVYHRSIPNVSGFTGYMRLNTTDAAYAGTERVLATSSTTFTIGNNSAVNASGATYVAYLFAHDAGGFGAAGTDNVISCGSFTTDANGNGTAQNIGFEPQWMLIKNTTSAEDWVIADTMRGLRGGNASSSVVLYPNTSGAEATSGIGAAINATGFTGFGSGSKTYIYIAIRRGPMRTPTSGTSVFNPVVYTGTNVDNRLVDMSLLTDMAFVRQRNDTVLGGMVVGDRLRGDPYLLTGTTAAEVSDADSFMTPTAGYGNSWSAMNGFGVGNDATSKLNASTTSNNQIAEGFRRSPGFFDVVCYTGTGANRTVSHNLGVVPELMIVKCRSAANDWAVYANNDNTDYLLLNSTAATADDNTYWNDTSPTSSVFSVGTNADVNTNTATYVAYLFASVTGVSKVGSYTGTGTTLQIDCGFAAGARFVLIKRTDSTGDWYVWDSARGIVAGNDPYLSLNTTAAEVTTDDSVDTDSSGFIVNQVAATNVNVNNATYIFLAVS